VTRVRELLDRKGSHVWTIGPSATVLEAAEAMNEHRIGALVVTAADRVVGIITERDVLVRVVAGRRDPASTRVADVMTAEVVCGSPETTVEEARGAMRDRRIRHLPVSDGDGRLAGLVSIGDLNALAQADQERTIFLLHEYILGRA
jgi:CBS domain-containing protein